MLEQVNSLFIKKRERWNLLLAFNLARSISQREIVKRLKQFIAVCLIYTFIIHILSADKN